MNRMKVATRTHARIHKRNVNPIEQSPWYTLSSANAGGAVTFKPYNSEST